MIHNDIKTLIIENFQSHGKTYITLAPGGQLTVVTGCTDSGKTAIFRALRWLLYNQPQGTDFIRAGCTLTRVTAAFASGHIIIRERAASKNQYRIISPGAEVPIILEGFGNTVPVEIQEISGIKTVTIGDMDFNLNMAEQLDGPFLGKTVSSGTRAKVLGKLAGTEVLDYAGKSTGMDLYRRSQDEKRLAVEADKLRESVAEYDYLPMLAAKIEQIHQAVEKVKANKSRWDELYLIRARMESKDKLIAGCNEITKRWRFVETAENLVTDIASKVVKVVAIEQLRQRLKLAEISILSAETIISRLRNLDMAEDMVASVAGKIQRVTGYLNLRNRLSAYDTAVQQCQIIINRLMNIEQAGRIDNEVNDKAERLKQILNLKAKIDETGFPIKQAEEMMQKLTGLNEAETRIDRVAKTSERLNQLSKLKTEIGKTDIVVDDLKGNVIIHEQRVAQLESTYSEELSALGVCPLCGAITGKFNKAS